MIETRKAPPNLCSTTRASPWAILVDPFEVEELAGTETGRFFRHRSPRGDERGHVKTGRCFVCVPSVGTSTPHVAGNEVQGRSLEFPTLFASRRTSCKGED
jgi:hypothetical protein